MMSSSTTLSIQIPDGAGPGDTLAFCVDGQTLEMEIPLGSKSGDVLEIQVGNGNEDRANDEGDDSSPSLTSDMMEVECESKQQETRQQESISTSIELSSGVTLQFAHQLPQHMNRDKDGSYNCDGTHSMAWHAGRTLVKYIDSPAFINLLKEIKEKDQNKFCIQSVLELGAGLGIVGIAFAHTISSNNTLSRSNDGLRPTQIVLSDVPSAVPLLNYNIQQNKSRCMLLQGSTRRKCVNVTAIPLLWHTMPISSATGDIDWIIGSDLLYNHQNIPALAATIQRLLPSDSSFGGDANTRRSGNTNKTRILLAVRWRKPNLEREFFACMNHLIDWTLITPKDDEDSSLSSSSSSSLCPCQLSWQEYGNPDCHKSNVYFSTTLISVNGTPTPLANIDESATQQMTNDEYEAFERMQIQIYIGTPKQQSSSSSVSPSKRGVKRTAVSMA